MPENSRENRPAAGVEKRQDDRSEEHLRWLLDNRSLNQTANFELFLLLDSHRQKLEDNVLYQGVFTTLADIAFSLWRAAFLSDVEATPQAKLEDLKGFLGSLLSHNSIQYSTDRASREWTVDYYLTNARLRLIDLAETDLPAIDEIVRRPADSTKHNWELIQEALEAAIKWLKAELERPVSA